MFIDQLYESILVGGWLLVPIFCAGTAALYLLLNVLWNLGSDLLRRDMDVPLQWFEQVLKGKTEQAPPAPYRTGFSYTLLQHLLSLRGKPRAYIRDAVEIKLSRLCEEMGRGLDFATVLGSVAPLMGLLGTVDGMVNTFKTITLYGNSNPVLLADGISEALLTTQAGLLIAFPVLLASNFLSDKIGNLRKELQRLSLAALDSMETHNE
jgi:biopolymer transport protein ExbB